MQILDDLGHYEVGGKIFTNKLAALQFASKHNVYPHWKFHSEVYARLDWTEDSDITLDEIYNQRAIQLREHYDYLTLNFSGGSDSWTVLNAFIKTRSHIDEIFVRMPFDLGLSTHHVNKDDIEPNNYLSEWDFTIKPMLNEIAQKMPLTKIVIKDWSDGLMGHTMDHLSWRNVNDNLGPSWVLKIGCISDQEKKAILSGKRSAVILGVDKPQMFYQDGRVYCFFLDKFTSNHRRPDVDGAHRQVELFFWTPKMPAITQIQAKAIFRDLQTKPQYLSLIDRSIPYHHSRKELWDQYVRTIIYNSYTKLNAFQTLKPRSSVWDENDYWMYQMPECDWMRSWRSGLDDQLGQLDEKFLETRDGRVHGLIGLTDGLYEIGTILNYATKHTQG